MKPKNLNIAALASIFALAASLNACDCSKGSSGGDDASDNDDITSVADSSTSAEARENTPEEPADEPEDRPSEAAQESAELQPAPALNLSRVLAENDLKPLTDATLERSKLAGKTADADYNAVRFHPAEDDGDYGLGLQLWKFDDDASAVAFVQTMRAQYLSSADAPASAPTKGTRSFISSGEGMRVFVFAPDQADGHAAALSCDETFCPKGWDDLAPIARKVSNRLRVSAPKPDAKPAPKNQPQKTQQPPAEPTARPEPPKEPEQPQADKEQAAKKKNVAAGGIVKQMDMKPRAPRPIDRIQGPRPSLKGVLKKNTLDLGSSREGGLDREGLREMKRKQARD